MFVSDYQRSRQRCRRQGCRYNTEVAKFKTISADESFILAGRKFSNKYKCRFDESKMLVRKDRSRRNSDNTSYNFSCGCRSSKCILQFRQYYNECAKIGGKKYFVYRVFVKEDTIEEALSHFKEMLVPRSRLEKQGISRGRNWETRGGRNKSNRKCAETVINQMSDERNESSCNGETTKVQYAHHHVEKFMKVVAVENASLETIKGISEGEKKMQIIRDGQELSIKNFRNGVLSPQYPICVMDSPESIGMKVDVGNRKGRCRKGRKAFEGTGKIIRRIANIVGNSTDVTVINVSDQEEKEGWTFGALANYFNDENRVQVLNQVSFEFSETKLVEYVISPKFVREVDWIRNTWPTQYQHPRYRKSVISKTRKKTIYFPTVQYYCVTSSAGAYMDFHIDVGGTSFWYHLMCGRKEFIFVEPTDENLIEYEKWAGSARRKLIFFPDLVKDKSCVWKMVLKEQETLIVPSGWIHAVYTERDSLAFGGNFLNGYSAQMQIKINKMEIRSAVEEKFRFPYFNISNVFAVNSYLQKLVLCINADDDRNFLFEEELRQLPYVVDYISSEYADVLKSTVKESDGGSTGCVGKYKTVYDEPNFQDAVQYVLRDQKCATMEKYVIKFLKAMTELYSRRT